MNTSTITLIVIVFILLSVLTLRVFGYVSTSNKSQIFNELNNLSSFRNPVTGAMIDLKCEPLSGAKRVYVSAGMFDLSENIYSIGIGGLMAGTGFSAMDYTEVLCGFSSSQITELKNYCDVWSVPWYGIVGEIEKMGWEAYCPVRDGCVMAPTMIAIYGMTVDDLFKTSKGIEPPITSMFNRNTCIHNVKTDPDYAEILKLMNIKLDMNNITDDDCLTYVKWFLIQSISTSIGANDLFAMYSSCNCCVFNENGLQADSGGLAELGNLGARGVPITIIKSQMTADFSGANNPMPTMCSSAQSIVFPTLLDIPETTYSPYKGLTGALSHLKVKVDGLVASNSIMAYGDANNFMPLPPLQAYWSALGSITYMIKNKSKKIVTTGEGKGHVDYKNNYTEFWLDKIVNAKDKNAGYMAFGKMCGENIYAMQKEKQWQEVKKFWT